MFLVKSWLVDSDGGERIVKIFVVIFVFVKVERLNLFNVRMLFLYICFNMK